MKTHFKEWVVELTKKYKSSQIKAAYKVNSELIKFYFELGKEINNSSFKNEYGSSFFIKLSNELKKELPNTSGFSPQNLRYIESFYILYRKIFPQVVGIFKEAHKNETKSVPNIDEILCLVPWGHHRLIIDNFNNNPEIAWFYINKIIENDWSRSTLENYIKLECHKREGQSINNFSTTLNDIPSQSIKRISKDPYYFDFVEVRDDYDEKELKNSLVEHMRELLLELGTGFSFVAQEYRIRVGESNYYIDLLFYNIPLHAYVVIEIKTVKFKPEFLGQLNFYVAAIDRDVKGKDDNKTIGLLICKDKDGVVAKYSLDNYNAPLGISSFDLSHFIPNNLSKRLPTIKELEEALEKKKD